MNFMNKARELVARWREKWGKPLPVEEDSGPRGEPDVGRYVHISKPITEDVRVATQLGLHDLADALLRNQRGHTLYTPEGRVKKRADQLADELGMNNKDRRRLRSAMRRNLRRGSAWAVQGGAA